MFVILFSIYFRKNVFLKSRKIPKNPEKSRKIPKNPEKSRKIPKNPQGFDFVIQKQDNVITEYFYFLYNSYIIQNGFRWFISSDSGWAHVFSQNMLDMQLFDGETQTKNHRNKKSSEISKVGGMIGTWFKGQLLTPNIKKVTVLRRNKKKS